MISLSTNTDRERDENPTIDISQRQTLLIFSPSSLSLISHPAVAIYGQRLNLGVEDGTFVCMGYESWLLIDGVCCCIGFCVFAAGTVAACQELERGTVGKAEGDSELGELCGLAMVCETYAMKAHLPLRLLHGLIAGLGRNGIYSMRFSCFARLQLW